MCLNSINTYNSSDTTGIMLKFRSVKTRLFDFIFHKSNHPFVYSKALLAHNILLFYGFCKYFFAAIV